MSKIGVIFPSRGLVFSRTADELLNNLAGKNYKIFFSHKRPIPECFNEPLERALEDPEITHIWIVEDDMILHPDTLDELLQHSAAVTVCDYPITKEGRGAVFKDADGKVLFTGTGCMLIKRQVFDELPKPYFRTDIKWNVKNYGDFIKFTPKENTDGGYGLHDINFCFELNRRNIPIHDIYLQLGQRKLVALGKAGTNDGAHQIEEWTEIEPDQRLKEIQSYPAEKTGKLVEVVSGDKTLNVTTEHAEKLVKSGKAHYPPKTSSVIAWGDK